MVKPTTAFLLLITASYSTLANPAPPVTNDSSSPSTVSIKEMLIIGKSNMKLHALAVITQGHTQPDESYMTAFKVCADDSDAAVRSLTAKIVGKTFIKDAKPSPQVNELILKLAKDKSDDVSFNAVYYGLCEYKEMSGEILTLIIDFAAEHKNPTLHQRVTEKTVNNRAEIKSILDRKLKEEDPIKYFEIYELLSGEKPPHTARLLDMPSSRPKLIVIKAEGFQSAGNAEEKLIENLSSAGLSNPDVHIKGTDDTYVLALITRVTGDAVKAGELLEELDKFVMMQEIWLTPEMEVQIEANRKNNI